MSIRGHFVVNLVAEEELWCDQQGHSHKAKPQNRLELHRPLFLTKRFSHQYPWHGVGVQSDPNSFLHEEDRPLE